MEHCLRKNGFSKQPFNIYAYEYVFKSESEKEPFRTKKEWDTVGTRGTIGHNIRYNRIETTIIQSILFNHTTTTRRSITREEIH